jgi:cell wall-associated NlpC family hydrolase
MTVATATAATVTLGPSAVAHASPKPTLAQTKQEIAQLNQQSDKLTEQYDGSTEQLATLQKQVNQLQAQITTEQSHLNSLENSMGLVAAAQYRSGGVDQTLQLMLSQHPDQFLSETGTLSQIGSVQAASIAQIKQQQQQLAQDKQQAANELNQLQSTRKQQAAQRASLQAKLRQKQQLLNTLTAAQRTAVEGPVTNSTAPSSLPAVSGRAAEAIAYAKSKLGDPYSYGATGPGEFDCSGLAQAAWAAAGVSIPRTTYEQEDALPSVPESDLQPGDLVFFYDFEHVGIYVGDGTVIHAPQEGEDVQYAPISSMPYAGAARP